MSVQRIHCKDVQLQQFFHEDSCSFGQSLSCSSKICTPDKYVRLVLHSDYCCKANGQSRWSCEAGLCGFYRAVLILENKMAMGCPIIQDTKRLAWHSAFGPLAFRSHRKPCRTHLYDFGMMTSETLVSSSRARAEHITSAACGLQTIGARHKHCLGASQQAAWSFCLRR